MMVLCLPEALPASVALSASPDLVRPLTPLLDTLPSQCLLESVL